MEKDFIFEEEYIVSPIGAIGINQNSILDFVQDIAHQENIGEPPIKEIISEEQTLPPQEPMPLKRSTRERRNAILDDYVVFL